MNQIKKQKFYLNVIEKKLSKVSSDSLKLTERFDDVAKKSSLSIEGYLFALASIKMITEGFSKGFNANGINVGFNGNYEELLSNLEKAIV